MSSQPKKNVGSESRANFKPLEPSEASGPNAPLEEEIRRRAYEIYLGRGQQPGTELDDWLQAEQELGRCQIVEELG